MALGPVQLLVIGFDEPNFTGQDPRRARPPARQRHRAPRRPARGAPRTTTATSPASRRRDRRGARRWTSSGPPWAPSSVSAQEGTRRACGGGRSSSVLGATADGGTSSAAEFVVRRRHHPARHRRSGGAGSSTARAIPPARGRSAGANGFLLADASINPADLVAVGLLARRGGGHPLEGHEARAAAAGAGCPRRPVGVGQEHVGGEGLRRLRDRVERCAAGHGRRGRG